MEKEVYFISGARTAFGRMAWALKNIYGSKLAPIALRGLLEKTESYVEVSLKKIL